MRCFENYLARRGDFPSCGREDSARWLEMVSLALRIGIKSGKEGEIEFEAISNVVDLEERKLAAGVGADLGWAARCAVGSLNGQGKFSKILGKELPKIARNVKGPVSELFERLNEFDRESFRFNIDLLEKRRLHRDDEEARRTAFLNRISPSGQHAMGSLTGGIEASKARRRDGRSSASASLEESLVSDFYLRELLDLVYHRQFTSWLQSQYKEELAALPNPRLPIEGPIALKVNVLAYFAAALAMFASTIKDSKGTVLPGLTAYILQAHINVHGPGACLSLLDGYVTDLKEKKTLKAKIANLQDFKPYEGLKISAAKQGLKLSLPAVQEAACKAARISDKQSTKTLVTKISASTSQAQDVTASTSQAQDVTASTSQAADGTSAASSLGARIEDLPEYRILLQFFESAGEACIIEAVKLQKFALKWRSIFENVGIDTQKFTKIKDSGFYASLQRKPRCSTKGVTDLSQFFVPLSCRTNS